MSLHFISKKAPEKTGLNYHKLREEAIRFLEKLENPNWTDFNVHDPGITIVESLCYAITDLSYRANLDVDYLLKNSRSDLSQTLEEAYDLFEHLGSAPVTREDIRKVLIDCEGIKNVFITLITLTRQTSSVYSDGLKEGNQAGSGQNQNNQNQSKEIKGLYDVYIEFEEDPDLGDLNKSTLAILRQSEDDPGVGEMGIGKSFEIDNPYALEVVLPHWHELFFIFEDDVSSIEQLVVVKINPLYPNDLSYYDVLVDLHYNGSKVIYALRLTVKVLGEINLNVDYLNGIKGRLEKNPNVFLMFGDKLKKIKKLVENVREKYLDHRNLCEDLNSFKAVKVQEIALSAEIHVSTSVNVDDVMTVLYERLSDFLAPPLNFKNIFEVKETESSNEKLYEGPLLHKGFVDDESLKGLKRKDVLYHSDVLNLIMSIDGVLTVDRLEMASYIENTKVVEGVKDCLRISNSDIVRLKLNLEKSQIQWIQSDVLSSVRVSDMEERYKSERSKAIKIEKVDAVRPLRKNYSSNTNEPKGNKSALEVYTPLQDQLPASYGVSSSSFPQSFEKQRKAKAIQLRSFLYLFDHFLASYMGQLANFGYLFSYDLSKEKSYFSNSAFDVPGMDEILNESFNKKDNSETSNDLSSKGLEGFSFEQKQAYLKRRHLFLNHLLARVGQGFEEEKIFYFFKKMGMYDDRKITEILLYLKADFIKDYLKISRDRFCASSFFFPLESAGGSSQEKTPSTIWKRVPPSGLEVRLSHLLGLGSFNRKKLMTKDKSVKGFHCIEHILLRPWKSNGGNAREEKMDVESDDFSSLHPNEGESGDGYSFRVSFFFPPEKRLFGMEEYRLWAESIIEKEVPSHIVADVHWADCNDDEEIGLFRNVELALEQWYEVLVEPSSMRETVQARLISSMNNYKKHKFEKNSIEP